MEQILKRFALCIRIISDEIHERIHRRICGRILRNNLGGILEGFKKNPRMTYGEIPEESPGDYPEKSSEKIM